LRKAKEAGLDLVEVAPNSRPPVCRIMDYGKWKYSQKKKEAKARAHSKHNEMKEVRLRPGTEDHDIAIKTNHAKEFLKDGHKVQFTILFKGRQMAHREIGFELCKSIASQLETIAHVEAEPKLMGRRMSMIVAPGVKQGKSGAAGVGPVPRPTPQAPREGGPPPPQTTRIGGPRPAAGPGITGPRPVSGPATQPQPAPQRPEPSKA
jgi:translation initiation factor IF-3